jgi:hypothetical protein
MFQILNQNLIFGQDSLKFHTEPQRGITNPFILEHREVLVGKRLR